MEGTSEQVQNFRDLLMGEWKGCEISGLPEYNLFVILRELKDQINSDSVRDVHYMGEFMIMFNNEEFQDPRRKAGFSLIVVEALEKLQEQYPNIKIDIY